jgi:hypothetical protein
MVDTPNPPKAPNPVKTAKVQGQINEDAAATEMSMNMVNQVTPDGKLIYTGSGDGKKPGSYTATTTLSPEAQHALDQQREFDSVTNQLGIDQTRKLAGYLDEPVSLDNDAIESRLMELGRKRLDPLLAQRRADMETKLYNQGVRPGTEAWAREMGGLSGGTEHTGSVNMAENDAYNQLMLTGRGQSIEEILTARNQPINEITALMGAQQIARPSFVNAPQTNVAAADYMGAAQNAYLGAQNAFNQKIGSNNALYGAVGSMAGTALGGWASGGFAT